MGYGKIVQECIDRGYGTFEERKACTRKDIINKVCNVDIAKLDEALANAREPLKTR